ncbi:hypothetical protein AVEN_175144-1 [Araneus ventricosus]|uniref:Uncharacterized protein n=1 Tax=Araneus ventricosus TaxID=182803 RepID=A0A4Y2VA94_ARAVE|nr:hypothetical protein AVEN_89484-1 [Araneus ventricosus]GBO21501.1 hypothetical protein AVEN_175144-1 [Araneus ventricosus]
MYPAFHTYVVSPFLLTEDSLRGTVRLWAGQSAALVRWRRLWAAGQNAPPVRLRRLWAAGQNAPLVRRLKGVSLKRVQLSRAPIE